VSAHLPVLQPRSDVCPYCFFFFPNSPVSASTGEFPEGFFPSSSSRQEAAQSAFQLAANHAFHVRHEFWIRRGALNEEGTLPPLPPMPASWVSPVTAPPDRLAFIL